MRVLAKAFQSLFGHFRIKLLALVISLGVWFYANSRLTEQVPITAGIEIVPPDGYALLDKSAPAARVQVAGPSWLMTRLESGYGGRTLRLKYELSEADLNGNWAELRIGPEWLQSNLPEQEFVQIHFRGAEPETVRVFASRLTQRSVPVFVTTTGEVPEGFFLAQQPVAVPAEVTVRGPAVALDNMEFVATEPIPLWNLRSDLQREPAALKSEVEIVLEEGLSLPTKLDLSVSTVLAHIYVSGEKEQEQTFHDVPLDVRQPVGFPYRVEFVEGIDKVSVTVKGPPQELRRLKPGSVAAFVNLRSLALETIEVGATAPYPEQVVGDLPHGVQATVVRVEPPSVRLQVTNPAE
jgi:hypothetical protein